MKQLKMSTKLLIILGIFILTAMIVANLVIKREYDKWLEEVHSSPTPDQIFRIR